MQDQKDKIIDLEYYLGDRAGTNDTIHRLVNILRKQSFVIVRDPRVSAADNDRYLDMMERYFAQPEETLRKDERPEVYYQVGVSKGQEKPRDHRSLISTMPVEYWPHITPVDYAGDPRWRFFRNLGNPPSKTAFPKLNAQLTPVIPAGFESEWAQTMDMWGNKMLASVYTISEMISLAMGLPRDAFIRNFQYAPHLIAPNGANPLDYPEGISFNGYHYDLNWGTIHGRSRFPGLRAWPRSGAPFVVSVPEGCLLFQVAKQLEWQTGGYFRAGFHEVVNLPQTIAAAKKAVENNRPPIRVSSTVFAHVASDAKLEVFDRFLPHDQSYWPQIKQMYPPILAGDQVLQELEAIGLKSD